MSGAVYKDRDRTPLDHRLAILAGRKAAAGSERVTLNEISFPRELGERRRMVSEALVAFRKYKEQWSTDTDVLALIKEQGSIPFDVWMHAVLYGPDGYYTSGKCKINGNDHDFKTIVSYPEQVTAFYFAMCDNFQRNAPDDQPPRVLSVASGSGDFELHFSRIHQYMIDMHTHMALPATTELFSLDVSEQNLLKQKEIIHWPNWPFRIRDGLVESKEEYRENDPNYICFSAPVDVLREVCALFDCTGTPAKESDLYRYYEEKVFPFLESRIDAKSYQYLIKNPHRLRDIAYFLPKSMSTPIAGSVLDLPVARGSLDVVFSNELHDALPSKIFVADPGSDDFEELYITYDAATGVFVSERRPVPAEVRPVLDLKLAFVKEHTPPHTNRRIPFSSALQKDYLVVNMASIQYLSQAARALKPGGLLLDADYTPEMDLNDQGLGTISFHSETIRAQLYNKQYPFLLDNIAQYVAPWVDVTTEMNPAFIAWAAATLSLYPLFIESQYEFDLRMIGQPRNRGFSGFKVAAFTKVNGKLRKKKR